MATSKVDLKKSGKRRKGPLSGTMVSLIFLVALLVALFFFWRPVDDQAPEMAPTSPPVTESVPAPEQPAEPMAPAEPETQAEPMAPAETESQAEPETQLEPLAPTEPEATPAPTVNP